MVTSQDPGLNEIRIRDLLEQATKQAVAAVPRGQGTFKALTFVEGGFAGIGEISVGLKLLVPVLKDIGAGGLGAAGAFFFNEYLAPRLRNLNLLPSKFHTVPAVVTPKKPALKGSRRLNSKKTLSRKPKKG